MCDEPGGFDGASEARSCLNLNSITKKVFPSKNSLIC